MNEEDQPRIPTNMSRLGQRLYDFADGEIPEIEKEGCEDAYEAIVTYIARLEKGTSKRIQGLEALLRMREVELAETKKALKDLRDDIAAIKLPPEPVAAMREIWTRCFESIEIGGVKYDCALTKGHAGDHSGEPRPAPQPGSGGK